MAKGIRICKVCGKEYEYCKTFAPADKFRWQDVACSPECGAEYFARVDAARNNKADETVVKTTKKSYRSRSKVTKTDEENSNSED